MPRILISGPSGLIGKALIPALERRGDHVYRLVRREPGNQQEIRWSPIEAVPPQRVSGYDAVIHLSGESVAGRWTESKKRRIRDSRVISTQNLATAMAHAEKPPQTFVCASAIGYYGNRGDEVLTEECASGEGFLAELSREWEESAQPAAHAGIHVVNLRIGVVLSRDAGALKQMILPFRLGLGGRIGSGRQWFSWIHVDDLVAAVLHILPKNASPVERRAPSPGQISGAVNLVSPNPVTNAEFTRALANAVGRPAILPIPRFVLRLGFGEFGEEGLLASVRAIPKKLSEHGFAFRYPELGLALEDLQSRRRAALSAPP